MEIKNSLKDDEKSINFDASFSSELQQPKKIKRIGEAKKINEKKS